MRQRNGNDVIRESLPGIPKLVLKGAAVFTQGEAAQSLFFLRSGRVKLTAVSMSGRQATIELIGEGSFFGETCFASEPRHRATATAVTQCCVQQLDRSEFLELVGKRASFAKAFIGALAERVVKYEDELLDQLFNSSERRLARTLILLAGFDQGAECDKLITGISHESLAEMVGTTRAHITLFMNKFRHLGLVDYDRRGIRVRPGLMRRLLDGV